MPIPFSHSLRPFRKALLWDAALWTPAIALLIAAAAAFASESADPAAGLKPALPPLQHVNVAAAENQEREAPRSPESHAQAAHEAPATEEAGSEAGFVFSISPETQPTTVGQHIAVMKLVVPRGGVGWPGAQKAESPNVAEALVWWIAPDGGRVSIRLRPVDDGIFATRVELPSAPGTHKLAVVALTEGPGHELSGVREIDYSLDLPHFTLTRGAGRQAAMLATAAHNAGGEGNHGDNSAPQHDPAASHANPGGEAHPAAAEKPEGEDHSPVENFVTPAHDVRRAGTPMGIWVLAAWLGLIGGGFVFAAVWAVRARLRGGAPAQAGRSSRVLEANAMPDEAKAATAAAPGAAAETAAASQTAAGDLIVEPAAAAASAPPKKQSTVPPNREVPDEVIEANQVLAGIIARSAPELEASALTARRTAHEEDREPPIAFAAADAARQSALKASAESQAASMAPAAENIGADEVAANPEVASSEELIKSMQRTLERAESPVPEPQIAANPAVAGVEAAPENQPSEQLERPGAPLSGSAGEGQRQATTEARPLPRTGMGGRGAQTLAYADEEQESERVDFNDLSF